MRNYALGLFSILLLAACTPDFPPPEPIDFESDPRVLRGEWTGNAVLAYPVSPLVYSPDGSRLFFTKAFINAVYDTATFDTVTTLDLADASVSTAQFSLDAQVLATTERDGYGESLATLWDAVSGERLQTFSIERDFIGFSRDLALFATRSNVEGGTEIAISNTDSRQFLYSFIVPEGYAQAIEVGPDLSSVAVFESREGGAESLTFKVWDIETGENLLELSLDPNISDYNILFSPDSSLLAITHGSLTRIWDAAVGAFLPDLGEDAGEPLAFSADNSQLVTKAGRYVRFWNVQEGVKLKDVELAVTAPDRFGAITEQAISPQLNQIAQGEDGQLQVADLNTGSNLTDITLSEPLDLRLNLEATYVDETSYDISGTLQYDSETFNVQGEVLGGGDQRYVRPATSPPPEATYRLEALDTGGEVRWILRGLAPRYDLYGDRPDEALFDGEIFRPEERWSRSFSLERQP